MLLETLEKKPLKVFHILEKKNIRYVFILDDIKLYTLDRSQFISAFKCFFLGDNLVYSWYLST